MGLQAIEGGQFCDAGLPVFLGGLGLTLLQCS